jgi:hypothetical protein
MIIRVVKSIFSAVLLSSLITSQVPSIARCQMTGEGFFAITCALPCCHTHFPMRQCPALKTAPHHDRITGTLFTFENTLQPLHTLRTLIPSAPSRLIRRTVATAHWIEYLFSSPAQCVRAPPANIHLLAA